MTSPVEESSRVVREIIESGAFDGLRKIVFEELKQSSALRDYVRSSVESSKALGGDYSKAQKERKRVLEELQSELKDRLVERASRTVWEILTNSEGRVALDLERTVHETLCRIYEERENQQQQQAPAERGGQQGLLPGGEGSLQQGAAMPPRPAGAAPSASLAGQPHQQQQQQQQRAPPPPRHYGVYGQ